MARYFSQKLVIFLVIIGPLISLHSAESICTSRFDFEEKLLQKMVKIEHAMEILRENINKQFEDFGDKKQELIDEFQELQESVTKNRDEVSTLVTDLKAHVEDDIENINTQVSILTEEAKSFVKKEEPVIFSVTERKTDLRDGVVAFSKVLSNEGGAYNVATGKFTCPVNGIYSFSFTIRSSAAGYVYCYIRKNGVTISYAISEGANDLGSTTVYPKLEAGDVVDLGGCGSWLNNAGDPTSFSGYLLYRL